ncbi:cytochrome d ubiquinol oxidase subunit II [Pseudoduganella ginsengisoli]|uniref:Cytochrome d ubiquinol oxidase subunit II n=1 Tax=Pseudoduganella ginsengisoli TaxID=1462440 RepID=A0A6L6Q7A0_9BURK|nr:cytochrome d ubiquinol oxidase subunit II [Pseudoduganella ginsengisoli]MTW05647.1 cytochrome d ubiquinol oxidase subunit II [Pseudoduganella ginsengisoli]
MGIDLSIIWAIIILFGIMMYIVMDGFDLGIGILYPCFPDRHERDAIMNTVAPVWDGNETWLVLGGAGLLAAFPFAYAVILSALYLPLIFMLVGLVFRGVAFEFRFKALDHERHFWDKAFIGGSVAATFFQGVSLGAYIQGFPIHGRAFAGGPLDWISPFALFCGAGLLAAYALLGSTWLIMKTEGALQEHAYRITRHLVWALLAAIAVISIWTPLIDARIAARWFSFPNLLWFAPVPLLVAVCAWRLLRALGGRKDRQPFIYTLALIFLGYTGLGISVWPHIVPPEISIWQAAAPSQSQGFALVGALLVIPVILAYTVWSYYVFRGKVRIGDGYH